MNRPRRSRRRVSWGPRFSLASILLLTAVVAVLLAGVRTAAVSRGRLSDEIIVAFAVGGLLIGAIIGAAAGAVTRPRQPVRAGCLGLIIGIVFGAPAGVSLTTPEAAPVLGVGAVVILVFAIVVRRLSGSPPRR